VSDPSITSMFSPVADSCSTYVALSPSLGSLKPPDA